MSKIAESFREKVASFIRRECRLNRDVPLVVALSGGADSVALLDVLLDLGYHCRAAHCNFHLRGEESNRDMRHCEDLCRRLGVALELRHFDVGGYRCEHGGSVEMACRDLRYHWFEEISAADNALIAVGHHSEDRAETFMLNLMRGTGIAGLTSMKPRSGRVVRPLLSVSRDEIEQYLADRGLTYIIDSSNASDAHRRNRLRNNILPALEEAFPGAASSIIHTISNLERVESAYNELVREYAAPYIERKSDHMTIDLIKLGKCRIASSILYEILSEYGFAYSQVCDMLGAAESSGQRFISKSGVYVAELSRGVLRLQGVENALTSEEVCKVDIRQSIVEPLPIEVSVHPLTEFALEKLSPAVAFFDATVLAEEHVWTMRHARTGDRMVPFGARKSKLLSDIFNNAKLSAAAKREQWLLCCDGEIVWLPALRNSAFAPITPAATHYLRLRINSQLEQED